MTDDFVKVSDSYKYRIEHSIKDRNGEYIDVRVCGNAPDEVVADYIQIITKLKREAMDL